MQQDQRGAGAAARPSKLGLRQRPSCSTTGSAVDATTTDAILGYGAITSVSATKAGAFELVIQKGGGRASGTGSGSSGGTSTSSSNTQSTSGPLIRQVSLPSLKVPAPPSPNR